MKSAYVLGIIGGILGLFGGLFVVGFGTAFGSLGDASSVTPLGWIAIGASVVAIVATTQLKAARKRSGWLMIVSGIVGLVATFVAYIVPAILLIIGGTAALKSGRDN